ncbi:hypothetical protein TraAM80_09501 [Trypanosoma rangeli]|uniref:Uncharacterized protein n=1 Tax=Trypanosoma rangeli TaxID=5698 RepID=A0A3R7LH22_TRYRA|nr:uncharacterized protein TraAM80_09501 [Trypanosoma rangeli]RNE97134.1 hypothetical protein TraAM80_09501 [Trypanosoma rangeli]|eukprot:RNE97134.1 hypothetical protein TraAM80_09501 [Trypanosoma rangeli]
MPRALPLFRRRPHPLFWRAGKRYHWLSTGVGKKLLVRHLVGSQEGGRRLLPRAGFVHQEEATCLVGGATAGQANCALRTCGGLFDPTASRSVSVAACAAKPPLRRRRVRCWGGGRGHPWAAVRRGVRYPAPRRARDA